jgi:phenylacetate-CoA ligase
VIEHPDYPRVRSRGELEAEQLHRLKWSIGHAYANTAYYRAKCDAARVRPDDLRTLDDLRRFPFTLKTDFRENYPLGMFAVPRDQVARIHASSGTTGKPTIVGYTKNDLGLWNGLIARSILAAGGRPGDVIHNAYGYGLFTAASVCTAERSDWAAPSCPPPAVRPSARCSSSAI